jgi:hypothetical protein
VFAVAETSVPPHDSPVAVRKPVALTVNIPVVFDTQVTWSVMSLVTGGWIYVPRALNCTIGPASKATGVVEVPTVSTPGWISIDTNCWPWAQLFRPSSRPATAIRTTILNHFPFINAPEFADPE